MAKRKQFTFYYSFYDALADLPIEQAQQGAWAIVNYGLLGRLPDMPIDPPAMVAFKMAKPVLDAARKKSEGATRGNKKRCRSKTKPTSQIMPRCAPDNAQEKEKEVENEVEVEKEEEIEKESYLYISSLSGQTPGEGFERFWDMYPIKLGKQQAWEAWQADPPDMRQVETAVRAWIRSRQWRQENGRFIPRAEKFLKEKHYLDLPKDGVPMGASGYLGKAELEAIERLMNGNV